MYRRSARSILLSRALSSSSVNARANIIRHSAGVLTVPATGKQTCALVQLHSLGICRSFHASASSNEVVKVPQMAESISEGTLKQWLKQKGDYVEVDEEVATIETDKIDVSVNAPTAGTITELYAQEEDTVAVGNDLFKIEAGEKPEGGAKKEEAPKEESKDDAPKEEKQPEPTESAKKDQSSSSSSSSSQQPSSKRQAPQDRDSVKQKESEPDRGRAEKSDEIRQPSPSGGAKESSGKKAAAPEQRPKETKFQLGQRTENRVKMNSMRKRIAERLKQSQNAAASLTTFNEIDMSALMALRAKYKDRVLKEKGTKLGFMGPFAKAACTALKEFPAANAAIEGPGPGEFIVYRDYIDMSIAVATPKGLVTPVVRNTESMSVLEIEDEIAALGRKARDGKLTLEDMSGGTFTISNGGVFGSLFGTPIINLPQAAVLGLHSIKEKAYVVNGKIEIRPIMIVALTYDHRLLDGREAVSVLVRIKELIEDPGFMLLQ